MSHDSEDNSHIQQEIHAGLADASRGQIDDARRRLANAQRKGAREADLNPLRDAIGQAMAAAKQKGRAAAWYGLLLGMVLYLCLSIQQPAGWTVPVWAALAFLVAPIFVGLQVGAAKGAGSTPDARFRAGFGAGGGAMVVYTGVTLIVLRARIGAERGGSDLFLIWLFVTAAYGAAAGLVAGTTSALQGRTARAIKAKPEDVR